MRSLTGLISLDTIADMPLPTTMPDLDAHPQTLVVLGLRAAWLHLHLTSPAGTVLTPRDREILTLVATSPAGMDLDALTDRLRPLNGLTHSSALRWIHRLAGQGWLEATGAHIDLPRADLDWITQQGAQALRHLEAYDSEEATAI